LESVKCHFSHHENKTSRSTNFLPLRGHKWKPKICNLNLEQKNSMLITEHTQVKILCIITIEQTLPIFRTHMTDYFTMFHRILNLFGHPQLCSESVQNVSFKVSETILLNDSRTIHGILFHFLCNWPDTAALTLSITSVNIEVPENTKNVPNQCEIVKSLLKYRIEKSNPTNFVIVNNQCNS